MCTSVEVKSHFRDAGLILVTWKFVYAIASFVLISLLMQDIHCMTLAVVCKWCLCNTHQILITIRHDFVLPIKYWLLFCAICFQYHVKVTCQNWPSQKQNRNDTVFGGKPWSNSQYVMHTFNLPPHSPSPIPFPPIMVRRNFYCVEYACLYLQTASESS